VKPLLKKILLIALGLVVVLLVALNFIVRKSVEVGVEKATGFPLAIDSMSVSLVRSRVDARGVHMTNPADFEERKFVTLGQLYVDYRLPSMLSGAPHVNEMIIDVNELVVVKNAKGESNVQRIKGIVASDSGSSTKYRVDTLRVKVGTVVIKDFSRGKPTERAMALNVSATYNNITDSTDISRLVLLTVMSQVKLPDIGIKADDLKKGLGDAVKGAGETLEKAGKGLMDAIKQVVPEK
jgi:uncharacterized protein involved in outer membrane biogenesis